MSEQILKRIGAPNYDPEKFVHSLSLESDGVNELLNVKLKVQTLAEETSGQLKRNVYKNYKQFIETAKEISYLESEMYQLSHMLTEQKALMATLLETSVLGPKPQSTANEKIEEAKTEEPKNTLTLLLEKVEGCASIVDVPGRFLVHSGELSELDPNTFMYITKIHAFLLNDCMVFAAWMPNRNGPVKYRFQVLYELDSLPVVNVRDIPEVKNAFKILMFPEARLFFCENAKVKKEWLEIIESTKKLKRNAESTRRESQLESVQSKEDSIDSNNPFYEDDQEEDGAAEDENHNLSLDLDLMPEWLLELPEDLDVCIAQRDFEEATNLIERANEHIRLHGRIPQVKEMRPRIDHRLKLLTAELQNELRVSPDKSLQGGPRSARRAVSLLIKLGKSAQACDLFLRHHSAIIKQDMKQLKIEGETNLYIRRLCTVFFSHVMETCQNLEECFPGLSSCISALVVWVQEELGAFVSMFVRQVFTPQVSLSSVADCVATARSECQKLSMTGLDMMFLIDSLMERDVERIFVEAKDKILEAIKLRAAEDKWRPINHQSKAGIQKFLSDMSDIGITNMESYVYVIREVLMTHTCEGNMTCMLCQTYRRLLQPLLADDCWISLTSNTIQFCKAYIGFVEDALNLYGEAICSTVDESLHDIFWSQLKHAEASSKKEQFKNDVKFIQKNGAFLLSHILPAAEQRFQQQLGYGCTSLTKLHRSYSWLGGTASLTKYSSGYV